LKLYISARIKNRVKVAEIVQQLRLMGYLVHNPCEWGLPEKVTDDKKDLPAGAAKACVNAMEDADALLLVSPIGKDCAWEVGWMNGRGKPCFYWEGIDPGDWMINFDIKLWKFPQKSDS